MPAPEAEAEPEAEPEAATNSVAASAPAPRLVVASSAVGSRTRDLLLQCEQRGWIEVSRAPAPPMLVHGQWLGTATNAGLKDTRSLQLSAWGGEPPQSAKVSVLIMEPLDGETQAQAQAMNPAAGLLVPRTWKYLQSLATGTLVLTPAWLSLGLERGRLVDPWALSDASLRTLAADGSFVQTAKGLHTFCPPSQRQERDAAISGLLRGIELTFLRPRELADPAAAGAGFRAVAVIPLPSAQQPSNLGSSAVKPSPVAPSSSSSSSSAQLLEDDIVWLVHMCGGRIRKDRHSPLVSILSRKDFDLRRSSGGWGELSDTESESEDNGVDDDHDNGGEKVLRVELVLELPEAVPLLPNSRGSSQASSSSPPPPLLKRRPPSVRPATSLHWLLDSVAEGALADRGMYNVYVEKEQPVK